MRGIECAFCIFLFFRKETGYQMTKEANFQAKLIKDIRKMLDGCYILKTDPTYIQGFPDLLILYNDRWAALECKKSPKASVRPNQEYYIDRLGEMSYASFICPENKEEILNELQQALRA